MENNNKYISQYFIAVGIRSSEFTYSDEILFANTFYFRRCYAINLSPYKALLFLQDYLNGEFLPQKKK